MRIQPDSVYALGCLAAREVAVSALGTIYAVSTADNDTAGAFTPLRAMFADITFTIRHTPGN